MTDATQHFKSVVALADSAPQEHAALMAELKMLAAGSVAAHRDDNKDSCGRFPRHGRDRTDGDPCDAGRDERERPDTAYCARR